MNANNENRKLVGVHLLQVPSLDGLLLDQNSG